MAETSPVKSEVTALVRHAGAAVGTTAVATTAVWSVSVIDWLMSGAVSSFSIAPWTLTGLGGIAIMPFVHAGIVHLLANTIAGVPLALMTMERRVSDFFVVSVVSGLTSGLGCWVFGAAGSLHVGASGVIFGYMGFLLARGLFERRLVPVALSLSVGVLFGGSLITMVPGLFAGLSWQAHLFGFLGGVLVSFLLGRQLKKGS